MGDCFHLSHIVVLSVVPPLRGISAFAKSDLTIRKEFLIC